MIRQSILLLSLAGLVLGSWANTAVPAFVDDPRTAKAEEDFYKIETFEIPREIILEAGALEMLPDGKLAVSTRRGEIYLVENPLADDLKQAKFTRFAHGLHEVLGLAYRDGWLYATQRGELTRIKDGDTLAIGGRDE